MKDNTKQLELLKSIGVHDSQISVSPDGKITILGWLSLNGLKELHPDALKGVVIGGWLSLNGLKELHPDALKGATIGGGLSLNGLKELHPDALKGVTIGGWLSLNGLKELHPDALKGVTIGGYLYLIGLSQKDIEHHKSVIQKLQDGYNEEKDYCYFDGILTKVLKVSDHIGYTIYTTPFGFVAQKDNKTAHGQTAKKAISDLEFKIISEKLKHDPINADTDITIQHYKAITGACDEGMKRWMAENKIEFSETDGVLQTTPIKAKDLLPLLEKTSAYGLDRFKELVNF